MPSSAVSSGESVAMKENRTADLEMAVLVQELMAMREDKSDLRAQVYSLSMSKESLEITVNTLEAQIMAMEAQLIESHPEKAGDFRRQKSADHVLGSPDTRSGQQCLPTARSHTRKSDLKVINDLNRRSTWSLLSTSETDPHSE